MRKTLIFVAGLLLLSSSLRAEIFGKVTGIEKDRGCLNITVTYFDGKTEVEKRTFLIADNNSAESEFKRIVCAQIKEIQDSKTKAESKPAETIQAKIKVGDEIRLPAEDKKAQKSKTKTEKK
ncbi:MAG: hypothetical protein V2A65_08670 [Candidatus Omnitrophota bacterium]